MEHTKTERKKLRSGFTTGACSAAAAKAALIGLTTGQCPLQVAIPFPGGKRYSFSVQISTRQPDSVTATIIKDAGDDPDVTHGAEICVTARLGHDKKISPPDCLYLDNIQLCRGKGIGYATKPGLAAKPGEPAINPGPKQMISKAVAEVTDQQVQLTISIPNGEELAEKTLNHRLGIVGGLSILGSTGIVRPVSAAAWKATIIASMKVARQSGLKELVLSTGRTSEKGVQQRLSMPEEAYAMMGDYLQFSLKNAAARGFTRIHLSGMWAKVMKAALRVPQTHVRNGALEIIDAAQLLQTLGVTGQLLEKIEASNTAREMFGHLDAAGRNDIIEAVCYQAKAYAEEVAGVSVRLYLIGTGAELLVEI